MEKGSNPFLNPEWLDIQRRYLESLMGGDEPHHGSARHEWEQALEQWRASVMPLIPDESKPMFDSLLDRSCTLHSLYDQFANMLKEVTATGGDDEDWQSILGRHIDQMKERFDTLAGMDVKNPLLESAWTASLEAWKQAFLFLPPDQMLDGIQGGELKKISDRFLSLPAFGPFREHYEMIQEGTRLWLAYQEKCREYRGVFYRLGKEALDRLQERILEMGKEEKTINSLRELYDLWIECNEEVFSDYAASEEYAVLYGELVTAYMNFRRQSRKLLEYLFRQLNLASGMGVAGLGRDQELLREAVRNNQQEQQQLRSTIEELKQEIESLRNSENQTVKKNEEQHNSGDETGEGGTS